MPKKIGVVTFLISVAMISAVYAQELDPVSRWATIAAFEYEITPNVVYKRVGGYECKLDVITAGPRSQRRPTLIYIHGGGWVTGTKEWFAWYPLPFVARGMNAVNVEYRLADQALAPAAVEDCRCALRWVYLHAKEYGFDTTKLVVDGHSAGGHLSLITGMLDASAGFDNECPGTEFAPAKEELKVAAIVNNFGIADVTDVLEGPHQQGWAVKWFGNLPNRMELAKKLSPITYVRSGLPPIISVHGTLDSLVPYQDAVRLHKALDQAGVPNQLLTIAGGGHDGWTREQSLMIQGTIFSFLEKHGIPLR